MAFSISPAWKGTPLHLVEALGVDQELGPDQLDQLAEVHLGDEHLAGRPRSTSPRLGGKGLRWRRWAWATGWPRARTRRTAGLDGAVGGAPAEDQHLGAAIGVVDLDERDVVGDAGHLGHPQLRLIRSWLTGS